MDGESIIIFVLFFIQIIWLSRRPIVFLEPEFKQNLNFMIFFLKNEILYMMEMFCLFIVHISNQSEVARLVCTEVMQLSIEIDKIDFIGYSINGYFGNTF